jgi:hypothetical protein
MRQVRGRLFWRKNATWTNNTTSESLPRKASKPLFSVPAWREGETLPVSRYRNHELPLPT